MVQVRLHLCRARRVSGVVVCLMAFSSALPACAARGPSANRAVESSIGDHIARTRARAAEARPADTRPAPNVGTLAVTAESWDPSLRDALAVLVTGPTAEGHRRVAAEYRRLGVLDLAHTHLTRAAALDPDDAAAYDGLARIWRDWGFPHLGLKDGHRAVELAPDSAIVANTLGTLYAAMEQFSRAYGWYARALTLDPEASYASNNFCYAAVRLRRSGAVTTCERAAAARPDSTAVRNNLGLAYAAAGDLPKAQEQFARAGDAAAHYNMGMVHMAQGRFAQANAAFHAALQARPLFPLAAARARQSRALMEAHGERDDDGD
jgi:tetratricopeptide (TPR) repeat protein